MERQKQRRGKSPQVEITLIKNTGKEIGEEEYSVLKDSEEEDKNGLLGFTLNILKMYPFKFCWFFE